MHACRREQEKPTCEILARQHILREAERATRDTRERASECHKDHEPRAACHGGARERASEVSFSACSKNPAARSNSLPVIFRAPWQGVFAFSRRGGPFAIISLGIMVVRPRISRRHRRALVTPLAFMRAAGVDRRSIIHGGLLPLPDPSSLSNARAASRVPGCRAPPAHGHPAESQGLPDALVRPQPRCGEEPFLVLHLSRAQDEARQR